jgi:hypothetical protein
MAALAAHEIGELAAILGNRIEGETLAERMRSCWLWLKERARDRFDPALYVAMADYRRRLIKATCADRNGVDRGLPPVLVLPQNWAELVSWAAQRSRDGSPAPIPPDLGVQLLYANGGRDHIRLASLFGEVNGITSRRLPARCFSLPEPGADSAPWELDDSGNPKIGAFLQAIGSPTRIAEQAARLVERFSILRHEEDTIYENLIDAAKDLPNRDLTLGLAVLFQVLKWEHARYQAWHKGLEAKGWIPHERRLDESDDRMSLGDFLRTLARFSRHFFCEPFLRADVFESCGRFGLRERDADTGWARWHFDLLVEAGLLTHDSKDDIYTSVGGPFDLFLVPIPAKLPDGFEDDPGERMGTLRDTLGFGKRFGPGRSDNDNAVGIRLAVAFCESKDPHDGREFLENLRNGSGPPWLLEILRHHLVTVLDWKETRTWPGWLRTT